MLSHSNSVNNHTFNSIWFEFEWGKHNWNWLTDKARKKSCIQINQNNLDEKTTELALAKVMSLIDLILQIDFQLNCKRSTDELKLLFVVCRNVWTMPSTFIHLFDYNRYDE